MACLNPYNQSIMSHSFDAISLDGPLYNCIPVVKEAITDEGKRYSRCKYGSGESTCLPKHFDNRTRRQAGIGCKTHAISIHFKYRQQARPAWMQIEVFGT
jgi:hypothetical protein